ncbi:MAG: HRDC domain-containing protein, partial [Deltaproteobacteria bacterium]|nr:HRDC domain-containing protein [Kofleriaceae bacterium]
ASAALRRIDALRDWRAAEAERSGLDVAIVMPQRLLERIADAAPETLDDLVAVEGVRRWRVSAWGPALLSALEA